MAELSIVIPCTLNHFFPDTAKRSVKVLEKLGYTILISENQGCCGYPFLQNGEKDQTKELAQKLLFDFQTGRRNHKIVSLSPRCGYTISKSYSQLFHNSVSHNLCQKVLADVANIFDIIKSHEISILAKTKSVLVLDCICDFDKIQQVTNFFSKDTNWLIKDNGYACCGGSNGLPKFNENLADEYFLDYVEFANKKGVDTFVFTDDLCMLHANQVLERNNLQFKTTHLFDILYEQLFSQID